MNNNIKTKTLTINYFREVIKKDTEKHFFSKRACSYLYKQTKLNDKEFATKLFWKWIKQKGRCAYTGRKLKYDRTTHIDHIIPRSKGGSNNPDNLQFVCEDANLAKNSLTHNQFIELIKDIMNYKIQS